MCLFAKYMLWGGGGVGCSIPMLSSMSLCFNSTNIQHVFISCGRSVANWQHFVFRGGGRRVSKDNRRWGVGGGWCTSAARTWILALDAVTEAFAGAVAVADEVATMRQCVANSLWVLLGRKTTTPDGEDVLGCARMRRSRLRWRCRCKRILEGPRHQRRQRDTQLEGRRNFSTLDKGSFSFKLATDSIGNLSEKERNWIPARDKAMKESLKWVILELLTRKRNFLTRNKNN